jgi:hypothetical protein
MTEAEVEEILGGPAGYYGHVAFCGLRRCELGIYGEWNGQNKTISVVFYKGKVLQKRMGVAASPYARPPSIRSPLWRIQQILSSAR